MAERISKTKRKEIVDYFVNNTVTLADTAEKFNVTVNSVFRILKEFEIKYDVQRTRRGHKSWNSGLSKNNDDRVASYAKTKSGIGYINAYGYKKIWSDELNKSVFEHHAVWFKNTGYWPNTSKNQQIHHIDGNKLNNSIDNLVLCSVSEHTRIHKQYKELVFKLLSNNIVEFDKDTLSLKDENLWKLLGK